MLNINHAACTELTAVTLRRPAGIVAINYKPVMKIVRVFSMNAVALLKIFGKKTRVWSLLVMQVFFVC